MNKRLLIFFGLGVVAVAIAVVVICDRQIRESHLQLVGKILKVRTGRAGRREQHRGDGFSRGESFRQAVCGAEPWRSALETEEWRDGGWRHRIQERSEADCSNTTDSWAINTTTGLGLQDTIAPHSTVDRMVAAHFEVSNDDLEKAKAVHLSIQDVDGPLWETSREHPLSCPCAG